MRDVQDELYRTFAHKNVPSRGSANERRTTQPVETPTIDKSNTSPSFSPVASQEVSQRTRTKQAGNRKLVGLALELDKI